MDGSKATVPDAFRAALVAAGVHRRVYALRLRRPELASELDEILRAIQVATETVATSNGPRSPLTLVADASVK